MKTETKEQDPIEKFLTKEFKEFIEKVCPDLPEEDIPNLRTVFLAGAVIGLELGGKLQDSTQCRVCEIASGFLDK